MKQTLMERVYETMACGVLEAYQMPGVEDAFESGSYCMNLYAKALDAYERLCNRLGVKDEDNDIEIIFYSFWEIQKELCYRMYQYGAKFGMDEELKKSDLSVAFHTPT